MTVLLRMLLALALVLVAVPAAAEAKTRTPYCTWTLSTDHKLVTVTGPEGVAKIKVVGRHGVRTFREVIDEGTAVHLLTHPRKATNIKVRAKAFTDHKWHRCAPPKGI